MQQFFEVASIDETYRQSFFDGIVRKLLQESGAVTTDVIFNSDDLNNNSQPFSTDGDYRVTDFGQRDKVMVEYEEIRKDENRIVTRYGYNRQLPIFKDDDHMVYLEPIISLYAVTMTVKRVGQSRDAMVRWVERLNSLLDSGRASTVVDVESFFFIPRVALQFLYDVYNTINVIETKYDSFTDYVKEYFHKSVYAVSDIGGGNAKMAARFGQEHVEIIYETDVLKVEKSDTQYEATLSIRFEYNRPNELQARYPLMIRQTYLPNKWLYYTSPVWSVGQSGQKSTIQQDFADLNGTQYPILPMLTGSFDVPMRYYQHDTTWYPVWGQDVPLDPDNVNGDYDDVYIMGKDDTPYEWSDSISEYIDAARAKDPTGQCCAIQEKVFINGSPVDKSNLEWRDGALYYTGTLTLDDHVYIVQILETDWKKLDTSDGLVLRDHADAVNDLLDLVDSEIEKPNTTATGKVDWKQYDALLYSYPSKNPVNYYNRPYLFTQHMSRILTYRKDVDMAERIELCQLVNAQQLKATRLKIKAS